MKKFIFVTGGVCSSLGKGIAASSLGALLESRGLNVRMVKCDPYININAGTMSPYVHGEIYVTDDGAQTDLDLGNYSRFTKGQLSKVNSMTTGQIYKSVIEKEAKGLYQGLCVQVIPHITNEIKGRILAASKEDPDTDIVIVEIGGTVGDIESVPFLEVARQMIHENGRTNALSVHLTLIPEVAGGELKTKPTQHSVKAMQEMGIQPDVLICRSSVMLDKPTRQKIALFTNVDLDAVFTSPTIDTTIYELPLVFFEQQLDQVVLQKLGVECRHANLDPWHSVMTRFKARKDKIRIAIVGEYLDLHDAYTSVYEAIFHAELECGVQVELVKIDATRLTDAATTDSILRSADSAANGMVNGILIPGDSGQQGINGMVQAAAWARANKVPYFGIGMGMQIMAIEWGRNALGLGDANSTESNQNTEHAVVDLLNDQGVTRLGKAEMIAEEKTCIYSAYGEKNICERHRHRYGLSGKYRAEMAKAGLKIAAVSTEGDVVECIEWPDHPWGVGVQFRPEFKSKPTQAAPLFRDFIAAAKKR